jgi:hypothetical protein
MTYPYQKKFIVTLKGDNQEMLSITTRFASYEWHIPKTCEAMEVDYFENSEELHRLRVQLNDVETFLDMLWNEDVLSRLFRYSLAKMRCKLCDIDDCSVRDDPNECLRIMAGLESKSKESPVIGKQSEDGKQ